MHSEKYFPNGEWRRSLPEAQGMDSKIITEFIQEVIDKNINVHSFLVCRNGYLVTEGYFWPYNQDRHHAMYSVSKSFTSTLIGIAESKGLLSVDDYVLSFFPEIKPLNMDGNKQKMKIKHLLTMSSGHKEDTTPRIVDTQDWVKAFLDLPVENEPGSHFVYNSGATYMLSAILQSVTGMSAFEYAKAHLFNAMGISDAYWSKCPKGINCGGWGLYIRPMDMLKMGYLFLNNGTWNGKQLVPEKWVKEATTKKIQNTGEKDWGAGYCYQWWRNTFEDSFRADGMGGQYIIVVPKLDMVVAVTSAVEDMQELLDIIRKYLVLAAVDKSPLPENKEAVEKLNKLLKEIENPTPKPVKPLPTIVEYISGKEYNLEDNRKIGFTFDGSNTCKFHIVIDREKFVLECGLDGIYRISRIPFAPKTFLPYKYSDEVAVVGEWDKENIFKMRILYMCEPFFNDVICTFSSEVEQVEIKGIGDGASIKSCAKA